MADVEASSTLAVSGSICGDARRLADLEMQPADVSPIDNKRPRLPDNVTKPERKDIMGEENPEYPNESRNWRGYARVPTDGGLRHLYSPLGILLWAGYNGKEHFFMVGKSDKWQPCIAAMKRCDGCHSTYPSTCEFCAHCGQKLPGLQDIHPSKRCETCKFTYAAAFNYCSKCGVTLAMFT